MCVVSWLHFSTLLKCPSVGYILCFPAVHSPLIIQGPGASWSQGNVWPAFPNSVCKLCDCSFLVSGVCPLVGETGLEACAGFLVGGVELGFGPLMVRALSRGLSLGGCWLRKS